MCIHLFIFNVCVQVVVQGQTTLPCQSGFSESVYTTVVTETLMEGQPLLKGRPNNPPNNLV